MLHNRNERDTPVGGLNRDQLLTLGDLEDFKNELMDQLKVLFKEGRQMPTKTWLRSSELKKMLGISAGTLQTLRVKGQIEYTKIGSIFFYSADAIEQTFQNGLSKGRGK